jgi:leucyl aminopeptidase
VLDLRLTDSAPGAQPRTLSRGGGIDGLRTSAATLARELAGAGGSHLVDSHGLQGERLAAVAEGLLLGAYRAASSAKAAAVTPLRIDLVGATDTVAFERGRRRGWATVWARDLANTPAAVKTPAWLATQAARELRPLGVTVEVRDQHWLADNGFGGVLAVGAGSASPPRLVHASWRPRRARTGVHVVLVGKGITFDTGGINLKPGAAMKPMHTDMSGAAAVLAALATVARAELPVRVTALAPVAENSFAGASLRPGDVIRHVGGRTSEVTNTDAEGRLVLADALAYAVARLRPTVLVDIATLTGAMKVALGLGTGGLFASTDALATALTAAGKRAGEPLWRLPLHADYAPSLSSIIADADNAPGNPGAITAALFLQPFTGGLPWAHLDIAGPARSAKDRGIVSRGATGFGARLLVRWIESLA